MNIETKVRQVFSDLLKSNNVKINETFFSPDMVLLESGLDSLGFATLVARLEKELGYDPFVLMDEPFYPRTYREFVGIYEKYKEHAKN